VKIESARLSIRPISTDDAAFVLELLNSESWIRFIGARNVSNLQEAQNYITERFIQHYEKHGYGVYAVRLRSKDEVLGIVTLLNKDYLETVDIGYAFLDRFCQQGYALEATQSVLEYANKTLGMTKIIAVTKESNEASARLLKRLGFHFEKRLIVSDEELMQFANLQTT
jgi:[ribosomal protein S5]-alanine N-acetyltransferase